MSVTPGEVFARLLSGIEKRRFEDLADLYAEDCVVELPFALPEPVRLVGRSALAAHFERSRRTPMDMTVRNPVVHETGDPEVIIAEWDYTLRNRSSGAELAVSNIQVLRVRDGKIVATRDFHNHAAMAAAMG
ncbi:nuclear transport factor 2 family protein [Nocardia sp. NBC_00416]|uniref:nuclear transport factor 2 family protein n=1 Tax=Nocardia sp. NBC_00416 TaxID=2975991 RepID=UPI002E1F55D2